jgi:hypothetical protein
MATGYQEVGRLGMAGFYALSCLVKVRFMLTPEGHPLIGSRKGAPFPHAFLPVAALTELGTALAATGLLGGPDLQLSVFCSAGFLGGVGFAQSLPNGPWALHGARALVPLLLVGGCTALVVHGMDLPAQSSTIGVNVTLPRLALAAASGWCTGMVLHALKAGQVSSHPD